MTSQRTLKTSFSYALGLISAVPLAARAEDQAPVEITVQGESRHTHEPPKDAYVAGSVVRGEKLSAPGATASDVLATQSGVQVTELGGFGAPATASIRGATSAQTPIYLAGVRLNDEVGGVANLSALPLWLIDRVEIYRGNAPVQASELGIGGAIFFEPRRPRRDELGAGVGAGSFGTQSAFARASFGSQNQRAMIGVEGFRTDNDYAFDSDGGTAFLSADDGELRQRNADVRRLDFWLLTRSELDHGVVLDGVLNAALREQGVPRLALLPSRRARADFGRVLAALKSRIPLGARDEHQLELQTSWLGTSARYDDPDSVLALLAPTLEVSGQRAEQRALTSWQLGRRLLLHAGADAAVERLWRRDGGMAAESHVAGRGRAVLGAEWELAGGLYARALGVAECQTHDAARGPCDDLAPLGRVGLGLRRGPLVAFANAGRYARFPSLGELYGAGILVRGNARLDPELGETLDLGVRYESSRTDWLRVRGDATAFVRFADRLIGYVRSSQGYVVPRNFQSARVAGLELFAAADFGELATAGAALTLIDPRDTTPDRGRINDILPLMSRLVLAPSAGLRTPELWPGTLDRARLDVEWLHRSNRYADAAGLVVLPGDDTVDVTLAADWLDSRLVTRARVENVFAAQRFDVVGYPLPSRSAFFSAELSWP